MAFLLHILLFAPCMASSRFAISFSARRLVSLGEASCPRINLLDVGRTKKANTLQVTSVCSRMLGVCYARDTKEG